MKLVIVESPTKARKLRQYLDKEYVIEASVGHIRDLPKNEMAIDIEQNFSPKYVISPDKKKVVSHLRKLASEASIVILATDPDREGEAIAWHLYEILKNKSLQFQRASFHEITKDAILSAIEKPGEVSMSLVEAQQARRIVDRLVGYEVSPVLWRKVRRGLSAGRVQSVALRLIVDKEREIEAFKAEEYWEVDVALLTDDQKKNKKIFFEGKSIEPLPKEVIVARVASIGTKKYLPKQEDDVLPVTSWLPAATYTVESVDSKERKVSSLPPFTTSTLQQVAANRLGFTSKQTMVVAQQLYEEGLITYHRTDSVNLSQQSITQVRDFIKNAYGKEYLPSQPRYFANRSKNAQEAHEAIRVTNAKVDSILQVSAKYSERHQKLYDLIKRRFIASQMEAAVFDQASLVIQAAASDSLATAELKVSGSVLKFDGWKRLFPGQEDVILPAVTKGQILDFLDMQAVQKFTQPPARFNDASLVKELEKRGIGRPSTYASIISVIIDRGYVERIAKRFHPTSIGMAVSDFLLSNFKLMMEYEFTAEMEEDLDRIARQEREWIGVVKEFYQPFHHLVEKALKSAERVQLPVEKTGETCPDCGKTDGGEVVIRLGKFGKFYSCSRFPDCKYTKNIVDVIEGVKCPLCKEGDVISRKSRWGKPFYGCGRYPDCNWASWQKPEVGATITVEEWAEQQAKRAERKAAREEKYGQGKTKSSTKKSSRKSSKKTAPKKADKKTPKKATGKTTEKK